MTNKVVIPRRATTFKQRSPDLKNNSWTVYTADKELKRRITSFLVEKEIGPCVDGEIFYNWWRNSISPKWKRTPVLFVPSCVADFLKENKHQFPNYITFHRKPRDGNHDHYNSPHGQWKVWLEGEKTPSPFFETTAEKFKKEETIE